MSKPHYTQVSTKLDILRFFIPPSLTLTKKPLPPSLLSSLYSKRQFSHENGHRSAPG